MNPGPYTLYQLGIMARGRLESTWNQTAVITSCIANRLITQNPLKVEDFPYCSNMKPQLVQATKAQWEAFANEWNKYNGR